MSKFDFRLRALENKFEDKEQVWIIYGGIPVYPGEPKEVTRVEKGVTYRMVFKKSKEEEWY